MRVDARRRREHRGLGFQTNPSQPPHTATTRSRVGEMLKIGPDGRGAPTKRAGVHVVVTAIVDMAHESGLWPGLEFHE